MEHISLLGVKAVKITTPPRTTLLEIILSLGVTDGSIRFKYQPEAALTVVSRPVYELYARVPVAQVPEVELSDHLPMILEFS